MLKVHLSTSSMDLTDSYNDSNYNYRFANRWWIAKTNYLVLWLNFGFGPNFYHILLFHNSDLICFPIKQGHLQWPPWKRDFLWRVYLKRFVCNFVLPKAKITWAEYQHSKTLFLTRSRQMRRGRRRWAMTRLPPGSRLSLWPLGVLMVIMMTMVIVMMILMLIMMMMNMARKILMSWCWWVDDDAVKTNGGKDTELLKKMRQSCITKGKSKHK